MLVDLGVACATGVLLGLWFRIPALLVSSGANAAVYFSAAPLTELEPIAMIIVAYVLLGVLQVGYLTGLTLSYIFGVAQRSSHAFAPPTDSYIQASANALSSPPNQQLGQLTAPNAPTEGQPHGAERLTSR